ncbi:MAG: hydroxymethylbilane synthase [Lachnospiraceae bacterium]|nr:hydroxymethylbilane synthase [Lachnospiraceae bacterium]
MRYVIGTRKSKLAQAQTNFVCQRLREAYPEDEFVIQIVETKGDMILDKPLYEIGDKGLFVKEIEKKILSREIDIGVHSMKDMPSSPAEGLRFSGTWKREDARDVLILREKHSLEELAPGSVIGTGSKRREFQLKRLRPDIKVVNIRGNVDTRLKKMEEEHLDGIVLAAAGLHRLGMEDRITMYLSGEEMISAPAQGALALEIREGEEKLLEMLNAFQDEEASGTVEAERGFLQNIGGDCHVPVGAVCRKGAQGDYELRAMFGNETGSRQAYAVVRGKNPAKLAKEAAAAVRRQMAGMVSLVGAGPGDAGLITVKGLQAIREADCIVYDRLATEELLKEAKPGCEFVYVGKASRNHTMKQEEINRLLVEMSMKYEKTVRLKGGDVYVFGRGGEEGIYLRENGVPFEVVPGISSAIGGLAYAGIPITHRGIARGFHVVTAHDKDDKLAEIDFAAMARGKETCVFLMGLSKVEEIANKLMEAGMSHDMKAAVISCGAMPNQRTCVSDLAHIAQEVKAAGLISPAMIVVGDVISLREKLDFFESRPLFGKRYLLPMIGEKSSRLQELLQKQGAVVKEIQVGQIVNRERKFTKEEIESIDWMIFTSKNGVNAFFENLFVSGLDIRSLAGAKIAAIGDKTSELLRSYGINADLIPKEFHSDAFAEELRKVLHGEEIVWYFKAGNADAHLKKALQEHCRFEEIVVYENESVEFDREELEDIEAYDGAIFTCASSALRLFQKLEEKGQSIPAYSIGPKTTACLKKLGAEHIAEAEQADYESLCRLVCADRGEFLTE